MKSNEILIFVGLLVISVVGFYISWFGDHPISHNPADWGPFGDFFGGILNPIMAGAGLLLIIRTIKQNEKALEQAKEMIEQGNDVINQNAQELRETREEVKQAREAQQKLAEIESKNLENKAASINQLQYIEEVTALRGEIDGLLSMRIVRFDISGSRSSYNTFFTNYSALHLEHTKENHFPILILKQAIKKTIRLCDKISNSNLISKNAIKIHLTDTQKSLSTILVSNVLMLTTTLKMEVVEGSQYIYKPLKEVDDEFNDLIEGLIDSMAENQLNIINKTDVEANYEPA